MGNKLERRTSLLTAPDNNTGQHVSGYAAVFDEVTTLFEYDGWQFREVLNRGAFDAADMSDVVLNYNHGDSGQIYARTTNGTLSLAVDDRGLQIDADIIDTTNGTDVYKLVKRGDLNKMSYAFTVTKDTVTWDQAAKVCTRRIENIGKVYDVSIVVNPAYGGTTVVARGADAEEFKQILHQRALLETYL